MLLGPAIRCNADETECARTGQGGRYGLHRDRTNLRSSPRKRGPRAENSAKELGPRFRGNERNQEANSSSAHFALAMLRATPAVLDYFRRRRCWPSPICLASSERAIA